MDFYFPQKGKKMGQKEKGSSLRQNCWHSLKENAHVHYHLGNSEHVGFICILQLNLINWTKVRLKTFYMIAVLS